jgi:hypothetical protein
LRYRSRGEKSHFYQVWIGWLFADMLLALSVFFIVANTQDLPPLVLATPTPPPQRFILPTVSPKDMPITVEHTYCTISIQIDNPQEFSKDLYYAIHDLMPKIMGESVLQNRQVGIAFVAAGGGNKDIELAIAVANQTYRVMEYMGSKDIIFGNTTYYDVLTQRDDETDYIYLDVYLVPIKGQGDTCNPATHWPY